MSSQNASWVKGKEYKEVEKNNAIKQTVSDLNKISETYYGFQMISDLKRSDKATPIKFDSKMTNYKEMGFYYATTKEIKYNVFPNLVLDDGVFANKSYINLGHEIAHAWADQFAKDYSLWEPGETNIGMPGGVTKGTIKLKAEKFAVGFENYLRALDGETKMRYNYGGATLFSFRFYRNALYFMKNPLPTEYLKD